MKYVIDITQLVHWSGNLTGIPRVMDELALRFLQNQAKDTIFVSWVKEVGEMCEVDFASTRAHRGDGIDYVTKLSAAAQPSALARPRRFARRVVRYAAARTHLDRTALYHKTAVATHGLRAQSYKVYLPEKSDALFIPWGEWWDQNWLDKIAAFAHQGVDVYPACHDILPMVVPQFSGNSKTLENFVSQIFPLAKRVIIESKSTKRDLTAWMKAHGMATPKFGMIRLGESFTVPTGALDDKDLLKKYGIKDNSYALCVGTIEPRKNHALLYYTYKLAARRSIELPKLLIVGRVGHDTAEIIKFIKEDPQINDHIQILNDVSDLELDWLYRHCMFTVMPSFYEGWGMPVIEGIVKGKPAACSNTSSLAEMPADCIVPFDPASTDECLGAIMKLATPKSLAAYLHNVHTYQPHTWDDTYKQLFTILKEK